MSPVMNIDSLFQECLDLIQSIQIDSEMFSLYVVTFCGEIIRPLSWLLYTLKSFTLKTNIFLSDVSCIKFYVHEVLVSISL